MATAYSIYDILRALVVKAGWVEEQQIGMLASIDEMQQVNMFGSVAVSQPCVHDEIGIDGRCNECGRRMRDPLPPTHYGRRRTW